VSVFICWVLFPLLFCLLALGCGLLVQAVSGAAIRGVLLLPVGYATIVVASQITTFFNATTVLATPLVVVLAIAGLALGARALWPMTYDLWPWLSGAAVFALYAAPVVLTGKATFLGYTLLGDTSIHFALIDWVMSHGFHAVPNGPPSSTHAALASYLGTAYPLGAHTALGAMRPLVGQDVAWIFQPYLALLAVFTSLAIYAILERAIEQRWLLALAAFLAAQAGLVYAYALEGSVKEMATIALIALLVAVVADYVRRRGGLRAVAPLAVTSAAAIGVLNASILPWLGPILVAVLVGLLWSRGLRSWRDAALEAGLFAAIAALLSFPSLWVVSHFVSTTTTTFTSASELGNLFAPLRAWQAFGIWPTGDFRLPLLDHAAAAYGLMGLEALAVVLGLLWALRRRSGWPLVFFAVSAIGWAYVTARSNGWGDAKALMIVSPAVVALAMLGVASLWQADRRPEALVVAAALSFGVLWTNALAFHGADIAPRARLAELSTIGHRFSGQGPTLYTEFEEFGKHFLNEADPTGTDESWQDPPRAKFANGAGTGFGYSSDVDQLAQPYVQRFRTLVLRRSGSAARPPSNYQLAFTGRYYEVWQKTGAPPAIAHLPLGAGVQPGAVPPCPQLKGLASFGGSRIAYVERPLLPELDPATVQHPRAWLVDRADVTSLIPRGPGAISGPITVTEPSRYRVWVLGSLDRGLDVIVDGRRVGSAKGQLNPRGQFIFAGEVTLSPGRHTVTLARRPRRLLYPGDGGRNRWVGPVVFDPASDTRVVRQLPISRWHDLCGKRLDWAEAIR
jgi:hypothetical protein